MSKQCLGTKPLCENGWSAVCNTDTGEWECRGQVAPERTKEDVEQSDDSDNDADATDRK